MKSKKSIKRTRGLHGARVFRVTAVMVTMGIILAVGAGTSSADTTRPLNIAALGDSISAAWGAGAGTPTPQQREQAESWSTGTDPVVNSHRSRIGVLFNTTIDNPHTLNNASSGSSVASPSCGLLAQINGSNSCSDANEGGSGSTHTIDPLPNNLDYVTFEGGTADMCSSDIVGSGDALPVADFTTAIHDALAALKPKMAPGGVVLLASIPDWNQLYDNEELRTTSPARPDFACPLLFEDDGTHKADANTRNAVRNAVNAYNNVLQTQCALPEFASFCKYDGGAVHAIQFVLEDLSPADFVHLSPQGQGKLAAAAWNAGWFGGTDPAVSGSPQVGQTLTAAAGTWITAPVSTGMVRSWWRCPAGNCASAGLVSLAGDQPTYTPVVADIGSKIVVKETATTGFGTATRTSAPSGTIVAAPVVPPVIPPAPPVPPASGGGGGGGGGGGPVADLAVTISAGAPSGGAIAYALNVSSANGAGGTSLVLTVQLPAGLTATSASTDRGSGCAGSTTVTCQLDFISGPLVAHVNIVASGAVATQAYTTTASVTEFEHDPITANNTASVTTPAASTPAARIPTIAGASKTAKVSLSKRVALVSASFTPQDADGFAVSLVNSSTGKLQALLAPSHVGSSVTGVTHTTILARAGSGPVALALRAPRDAFTHPSRYKLKIVVSTAAGLVTTFMLPVKK